MLSLTRKPLQRILTDCGVSITVEQIRGKSVRIGITAPNGVRIIREELLERMSPEDRARFTTGAENDR